MGLLVPGQLLIVLLAYRVVRGFWIGYKGVPEDQQSQDPGQSQ